MSEFIKKPLREAFYEPNELRGIRVADPFMGGGTPLPEANLVGCEVIGYDINPMAYWIVKQQLENLDLLEKNILSKAFRGELGTNDPGDEPAIVLLKRSLNEKSKAA